jgi:hypothetical protein
VEFSPKLDGYKVYPGIPDQTSRAAGFTLTESGEAFVTNSSQNGRATYTLDRASGQWREVTLPGSESPVVRGSEKNTLVFSSAGGLLFYENN